MPTIAAQLDSAFRTAIRQALAVEADPQIGVSQNERFGDYQCNAAMGLARQITEQTGQKTNPRQVAERIRAQVEPLLAGMASEVTIAGPGFINVRLSPQWLANQITQVQADERLGVEPAEPPQRVVVDYSGPNIAKEMHVGHLRSTIIGDCIARTLAFIGHDVVRQNHIGDWGLQMGMVTWAVEQAGKPMTSLAELERMYRQVNKASEDPAVRLQMIERTKRLQQTPKSELVHWQQVRKLTLDAAQNLYGRLDVSLSPADVRGESDYSDQYGPMVDELRKSGVAVETQGAVGIFPPGFTNKEGEPRPFIVQSRDGSFQYPTFDLAAIRFRVTQLGAQRIIYTHDSRQAEHFAMLFGVAKMLGLEARTEYAPFGTVLGEDGKPLKTRSGENVKLADLIDEAEQRAYALVTQKNPDLPEDQRRQIAHIVGVGAVKYADLSKDRTSDYVFSWDKMLAMDGNTAPYLQYACARIRSIFRKASAEDQQLAREAQMTLTSTHELALGKHILRLGEVVELVARELKPHHLCTYLYELATRFSGFYENCPVLQSDRPLRNSRLALCDATAQTLARGLDLLGIGHPEQM
jgi:arginyl-tRNA synthetase